MNYRKFKHSDSLTSDEMIMFSDMQFEFDPTSFGAYVICDNIVYTEVPVNCTPETVTISYRNGNYRADAVVDGFVDEFEQVWISEFEMEAGICIEWEIGELVK